MDGFRFGRAFGVFPDRWALGQYGPNGHVGPWAAIRVPPRDPTRKIGGTTSVFFDRFAGKISPKISGGLCESETERREPDESLRHSRDPAAHFEAPGSGR